MMMAPMNNAKSVIKLGINMFWLNSSSSTKAGDYESCDDEDAVNHCLICDPNVFRKLNTVATDSYCSC